MVKNLVKKILPPFLRNIVQKKYKKITIFKSNIYDLKRYSKYSGTNGFSNKIKLEAIIVKEYHVIEKGLTMPNTRFGFGEAKIISLYEYCDIYVSKYGLSTQIKHAISVIKEYKDFHLDNSFQLNDKIEKAIEKLLDLDKTVLKSSQIRTTKEDYFKNINSPFPVFSATRKSVRNYSNEDISLVKLEKALELALNTPSACNKQGSRIHIYSDKNYINRILNIQGGSRGFGDLTNKLIIITSELGAFSETTERYQAYIDGGMFAMNLLYALHSQEIACCILNCSNTPEKDKALQSICKIKKSEVFIAMIACGIPPEEFSVALSPRYDLIEINTYHE